MSKKNEQQPEVEVFHGEVARRIIKKLEGLAVRAGSALSLTRAAILDPIGFGRQFGKLEMKHAAKAQRVGELRKENRMLRSILRDRDGELTDVRAARNEDRRRIVELQRALHGPRQLEGEDKAAVDGLAANLRNGTDGQALPAQGEIVDYPTGLRSGAAQGGG